MQINVLKLGPIQKYVIWEGYHQSQNGVGTQNGQPNVGNAWSWPQIKNQRVGPN